MTFVAKSRLARFAIAAAAFLLAACAFAPALRAGFHIEDFSYLVLMRHLDTPWSLLTGNAFFSYYYRPTGLLFWWASTRLAGYDPWWHNLIDLLLFSANAALLALLARRLARDGAAGLIAGAAFACMPAAVSTALWMSDRYDLLAFFFGLLTLFSLESALEGSRRAVLALAFWLFLAITSKEIGYAFAACAILRAALQTQAPRTWRAMIVAVTMLPVAAALMLRAATVEPIESSLRQHDLAAAAVSGIGIWWQDLPAALFGFREQMAWLWLLAALLALTTGVALLRMLKTRTAPVSGIFLAGAVLLALPSVLQWPVTSLVLSREGAQAFVVNLRFYHLAAAGVALLLGATWPCLRTRYARAAYAAGLLVLCAACLGSARSNARDWRKAPVTQTKPLLAFGSDLGTRTFPPGCNVRVDPDGIPPFARPHIDAIVKTSAAPGAPILGCSVSAGRATFTTWLDEAECSTTAWPGQPFHELRGKPAMEMHGPSCFVIFATPPSDDAPAQRFDFRMDAQGHAQQLVTGTAAGH